MSAAHAAGRRPGTGCAGSATTRNAHPINWRRRSPWRRRPIVKCPRFAKCPVWVECLALDPFSFPSRQSMSKVRPSSTGMPKIKLGFYKFLQNTSAESSRDFGADQCRDAENRTRILRTRSVRNTIIPHPDTDSHLILQQPFFSTSRHSLRKSCGHIGVYPKQSKRLPNSLPKALQGVLLMRSRAPTKALQNVW